MMEIKCYKSTLITLHFIFLTWGPTFPGVEFLRGQFAKGPNCPVPILTMRGHNNYFKYLEKPSHPENAVNILPSPTQTQIMGPVSQKDLAST